MNFGEVLELLKSGANITRELWAGEMWLTESFHQKHQPVTRFKTGGVTVKVQPRQRVSEILICSKNGSEGNEWLPLTSDLMSNDWKVCETIIDGLWFYQSNDPQATETDVVMVCDGRCFQFGTDESFTIDEMKNSGFFSARIPTEKLDYDFYDDTPF